ncbi:MULTISPECIES: SDR family NAD(P)-dependent oxidoreductase [unclassified Fibrobacter]|uniref:SDR family NAD(P)-dependent oxidoreductase n=1 Tax=unclassified Fibrobacter TaxID=2634177 RepID=UPI00091393BA|nr:MULTISPECIES: SDR family oxidoreductase [unclassified Fibrobacter]OWV05993.1 hypothetical protein B7993_07155 [Fibrobacter sp. UWH3]SHL08460.1 NAD(P)-dependent dehydrogenase, short-chain alcohol dehydrogenase family [Fibrobacter sp. UWH6]
MNEFLNKTVLITGAVGGIGKETAKAFAEEGANLVLVDLNKDALQKAADEINIDSKRIHLVAADVTQEDQVANYVSEAEKAFGKIDVFFNNAGVLKTGYVKDTEIADLKKIWDVNVLGVFLGLKYVIRSMEKTGGGSIIDTGSIDSFGADAGNSLYASSKYAVLAISKCAALEEASKGIRVNTICPGPVNTSMMTTYVEERFPGKKVGDIYDARIPMARVARPRDIANAVLFLASDRSSYMTGTRIVVDGGYKHE